MERNAFLAMAGERERSWPRALLVLVVGGAAAALAIGSVMMAALGAASLALSVSGGLPYPEAYAQISDSARAGRTLQSYVYELSSAGLGSFAAGLAFIAVAARVYKRPIRSFLTSAAGFRWQLVLMGLVVSAPVMAASLIASAWGRDVPSMPLFAPDAAFWARAVYVAASLVFLYLAAVAEEMLFRGWLLQQSGVFVRNAALMLVINGLVFSAAHFDPNPGAFLIRATMGMAWSWVVLRTGGVEFALGAHLANNLAVSLFVKPVSFAPVARQPIDYRELVIEAVGMLVIVAAVEVLVRCKPARRDGIGGMVRTGEA